MESAADRTRALVYAIGVHVLAALIMFAGLFVSAPKKPVIAGGALEAVLVDMNLGRPLPKPATRPTPKPEPPKPVPKPEPAPPRGDSALRGQPVAVKRSPARPQ